MVEHVETVAGLEQLSIDDVLHANDALTVWAKARRDAEKEAARDRS